MLLAKISVLDKGYVALIDSSNTTKKLREIDKEFFGSTMPPALLDIGTMTVVMKCPLFVQLNLSKFTFKVINAADNRQGSDIEAYAPNAGEVCARERDASEAIADDIARTTAALLINPRAYRADGADRFISQVIIPINVYTTIIVHGSYDEWCKFCDQKAPAPIAAYIEAITLIKTAEWK